MNNFAKLFLGICCICVLNYLHYVIFGSGLVKNETAKLQWPERSNTIDYHQTAKNDSFSTKSTNRDHDKKLTLLNQMAENIPLCPEKPPGLRGRIQLDMRSPPWAKINREFIVPLRDRDKHLRGFLHNIHWILQRQQLNYTIFVVEQSDRNLPFNRGRLMNVGMLEASKIYGFDCYVFHDVDHIPENDMNLYTCPTMPNQTKHMIVAIDYFNYQLSYNKYFGGVSILTKNQFRRVNGFSNDFWGWGSEDDDLYTRVHLAGMSVWRSPTEIGRYSTFRHGRDNGSQPNPCHLFLVKHTKEKWQNDGLNSIHYVIKSMLFKKTHTQLTVNLQQSEYQKYQHYRKTLGGC